MISSIKKIYRRINSKLRKAKISLTNSDNKIISENDLIQYKRVQPWLAIRGDETLRLDYMLDSNSVVFDIGGYKGEFASAILCKYNPFIYVFEPVEDSYLIIKNRFIKNPKVSIFNFGFSKEDCLIKISLNENSSSVYLNEGESEIIQLKSITNFIKVNDIKKIDLMKINIEGGEYELLEILIENRIIKNIKNVQVQFHDFLFENSKNKMEKIQNSLSKTHKLTYQYKFVWENWEIKN